MTTPSMPWIKLYTTLLNDARLGKLDDAQKWRYIALYMLAGRLDAGGFFVENGQQLSPNEIAFYLRSDPDVIKADLRALKSAGLAIKNGHGWSLPDFEHEQGPSQAEKREQWKERQARHRDTKGNASVTGDNQSVTSDNVIPPSRVTNAPRLKIKTQEKDKEGVIKESDVSEGTQTQMPSKPRITSKRPKGLKGIEAARKEREGK